MQRSLRFLFGLGLSLLIAVSCVGQTPSPSTDMRTTVEGVLHHNSLLFLNRNAGPSLDEFESLGADLQQERVEILKQIALDEHANAESSFNRLDALMLLGSLHQKDVFDTMKQAAESSTPQVRCEALRDVAEFYPEQAVAILIKHIDDHGACMTNMVFDVGAKEASKVQTEVSDQAERQLERLTGCFVHPSAWWAAPTEKFSHSDSVQWQHWWMEHREAKFPHCGSSSTVLQAQSRPTVTPWWGRVTKSGEILVPFRAMDGDRDVTDKISLLIIADGQNIKPALEHREFHIPGTVKQAKQIALHFFYNPNQHSLDLEFQSETVTVFDVGWDLSINRSPAPYQDQEAHACKVPSLTYTLAFQPRFGDGTEEQIDVCPKTNGAVVPKISGL